MSSARVAVIGALMGLVTIGVAVGLIASGVLGSARRDEPASTDNVLSALVLPDENGVVQPRVVDLVSRAATGWAVASVDPTLGAVVPGTSGSTLADAYAYGGGAGLLAAYNALGRTRADHWVVVDPQGWSRLLGSEGVTIDLPAHMEVFDGRQLLTFEAGPTAVPATATPVVLDGASYLDAFQAADIRRQIGSVVLDALASHSTSASQFARTDLSAASLDVLAAGWANAGRVPGD